jgi:hypothetical protein
MGFEADGWRLDVTLDAHAGERERREAGLWAELQAHGREFYHG